MPEKVENFPFLFFEENEAQDEAGIFLPKPHFLWSNFFSEVSKKIYTHPTNTFKVFIGLS